jgi:hypothetical protein
MEIILKLIRKRFFRKMKKIFKESIERKMLKSIKEMINQDKDFDYKMSPAKIKIKKNKPIVTFRITIFKDGIRRAEMGFNSTTSFFGPGDIVKEQILEELDFQEHVKKIFGTNNFELIRRRCKQC